MLPVPEYSCTTVTSRHTRTQAPRDTCSGIAQSAGTNRSFQSAHNDNQCHPMSGVSIVVMMPRGASCKTVMPARDRELLCPSSQTCPTRLQARQQPTSMLMLSSVRKRPPRRPQELWGCRKFAAAPEAYDAARTAIAHSQAAGTCLADDQVPPAVLVIHRRVDACAEHVLVVLRVQARAHQGAMLRHLLPGRQHVG